MKQGGVGRLRNNGRRPEPTREERKPGDMLWAVGGPLLVAAGHVLLYVVHRASVGTAPAEVPGELVSFVVTLVALNVMIYRRGTSGGFQAIALAMSLVSLFIAPIAAFILLVLMSAR